MLEKHYAEVTRNTDPEEGTQLRGAVYFKSETLTGDVEYPLPAQPCFHFAGSNRGFFFVPEPGDIIEIEIDNAISTPEPKWLCMVYSSEDDIPREFSKNYTKRMGYVSKSGHAFVFDDTDGAEEMFIQHMFGSRIKFFDDGSISMKSREIVLRDETDEANDVEGAVWFGELLFDFPNKIINLIDKFENSLIFESSGVTLFDSNQNSFKMSSGGIELKDVAGNTVKVGATNITITDVAGNKIEVGPAGINVISVGPMQLDAPTILMAGGGPMAARMGDLIQGIGNLGAPVIGQIIIGSTKVFVGG